MDLTTLNEGTLLEARAWLRARVDDGEHCPCCGQYAKVYKRTINAAMARALIAMYHVDTTGTWGWMHLPTAVPGERGDACKTAYWGLIEEESVARPDGGRSGWWRLTPLGGSYVRGTITMPKYAKVYDGRCLGLTGPLLSIRDALGTRFDYAELMAA